MSIPTDRELLIKAAENLLNAANGYEALNPTLARRLGAAVVNDKGFGVDSLSRLSMQVEALAASAPAQQATPPQPVAEEVTKDAERYRWLREQNWDNGMLCVVRDPIKNLRLGADCPSLIRLDEFIDAAMAGTGSDESKKEEA